MKPMSSLCNTNKVFFCRILWGKFTLKTNFKMRIIIFFRKDLPLIQRCQMKMKVCLHGKQRYS